MQSAQFRGAWLVLLATAAAACGAGPLTQVGADGQVELTADSNGDRLADFSWCGYGGGGVALPRVKAALTLQPAAGGDDTSRIQKAIDQVSALPLDAAGLRGALVLRKGTYRVEGALTVKAGGVVLRGEGQGTDGTVIVATGTHKRTLITVGADHEVQQDKASRREITAARVAAGTRLVELENTTGLSVGDRVVVVRRSNREWIRTIKMETFKGIGSIGWTPEAYEMPYERQILAIRGNTIGVDVPLVMAIETTYGGGFVAKVTNPRIRHVGVENIRLVSAYQKGAETRDEKHAWNGIEMRWAEDGWVRNVTGQHFAYSTVSLLRGSRRMTVADSANLDPVSLIEGGRRYSFQASGQQGLITRCYSRGGRHDFVQGARALGPNTFLDCFAENAFGTSEPHHRFSTGTLYDNVVVTGRTSGITVGNRGNSGSGHGWSGAWVVFWNCGSNILLAMEPPTARNAIVGARQIKAPDDGSNTARWFETQSGQKLTRIGPVVHDGRSWIHSPQVTVTPRSLYLKQLATRLGAAAAARVALPAQLGEDWNAVERGVRTLAR
jgi:hypothetical protein